MSNKPPIFIVSAGNSGACVLLEMLKLMGVHVGAVDEKKELPFVVAHNTYFLGNGKDVYQKYTPYFPFINIGKLRDGLLDAVNPPKGKAWAVQDQRMCLTWHEWKKAFPDAKTIIIERDLVDICMDSDAMGSPVIEYRQECLDEIKQAGEAHVVQYEQLVIAEEFRKAFKPVVEFCGIKTNTPANAKKLGLAAEYMAKSKMETV